MNSETTSKPIPSASEDLKAQREYARNLHEEGFDFSLVVGDAFVRGIRDIGYKSTATAIDELIDNAIQAEAAHIHTIFGYDGDSQNKPDRIAVIDDGHGMDPDMIRAAVIWGGTHRENDRSGFGRYGYGLPSASVSQGRRFTVYSKTEGGEWHQVNLDVDEISAGRAVDEEGRLTVRPATKTELPKWVTTYIEEQVEHEGLEYGTVVVLEKLDKLTWTTTNGLTRNLLEHLGITYRNFLREISLYVDGTEVDPVDPLFTTPGYRFHDLDEDRAESFSPMRVEVKERGGDEVLGTIKVRFSLMPPTFASKDKSRAARGSNQNKRFPIMRDHNGIIFLRAGRQIDIVTSNRCPWFSFQNNDRYWGVEVDFPPTLDEEFSITTSKQQIVVSDRLWDILKDAGVKKAIEELKSKAVEQRKAWETERDQDEDQERTSEQVMKEVEKFKTKKPSEPSTKEREKQEENLKEEAERKSKETGVPVEDIEEHLREEAEEHPYKVETERSPGAPFFRVVQRGGQKVLYLNTAHRFFSDVYAASEAGPRLRSAMEVLLFVIGDCELDASNDRRRFYQVERTEWSRRLEVALDLLGEIVGIEDQLEVAEVGEE